MPGVERRRAEWREWKNWRNGRLEAAACGLDGTAARVAGQQIAGLFMPAHLFQHRPPALLAIMQKRWNGLKRRPAEANYYRVACRRACHHLWRTITLLAYARPCPRPPNAGRSERSKGGQAEEESGSWSVERWQR